MNTYVQVISLRPHGPPAISVWSTLLQTTKKYQTHVVVIEAIKGYWSLWVYWALWTQEAQALARQAAKAAKSRKKAEQDRCGVLGIRAFKVQGLRGLAV